MNRTKVQENRLYKKIKEICGVEGRIVLFDAEETMDWGRPIVDPDGIRVTARISNTIDGVKTHFYPWEDISFLCHEGFVLRKVKGLIGEIAEQTVYKLAVGRDRHKAEFWREVYIGDPLRMSGEFQALGGGLLVSQRYGAEGVVMPQTLLFGI